MVSLFSRFVGLIHSAPAIEDRSLNGPFGVSTTTPSNKETIMTNQTFKRKLVWTALAALVALAITLSAGAGTGVFAQTAHTEKQEKGDPKSQAAGQQSAIDAKTGKVQQPTQEEADTLNEAIKKLYDRPTEGLKTTYLADGTVMVELPDEFMEVSVIKINPDGSKSVECVTGMKAAEESLKAQGAGAKATLAPGAPAAQPVQKATVPPGKGEAGKTPQKNSQDKSKWEVM
jgi:hypothetical protein